MGDFMQYGETELFAQIIRVGKILQQRLDKYGNLIGQQRRVEVRPFRQRNALVNAVERVVARIETLGAQELD